MHPKASETLAFCPRTHARKRPPARRSAPATPLAKIWNGSKYLRVLAVAVKRAQADAPTSRDQVPTEVAMPEVIFTGAAGRIEGRYHPARQRNAPIGIVLHPHPQFGGTMNHQIIYQIYYAFAHRNFSVLRFNFRGVGRSQGSFDHGQGELSDAASALDWAQSINPEARSCWIAGFSFGAWIGMQLLMRRPEIEGFISIAPPANLYDFSFLAPCPSSGMIVHGDKDAVVPHKDVCGLVEKLKTQKGIVIEQKVIPGANHFFDGKVDVLMQSIGAYLDKRLKTERKPSAA
jgi:alpha/beta superfamily hydrolase